MLKIGYLEFAVAHRELRGYCREMIFGMYRNKKIPSPQKGKGDCN